MHAPGATTHAPPEQPRMPPLGATTHALPPLLATTHAPSPLLTESQTGVKT